MIHQTFAQVQYEWEATYNSGSNRIDAKVIADYAGNVYVAGTTLDTLGTTDWQILKYDLKGELIWDETYNGSGDDYVAAVALDEDDNLIVVGTTATSGNGDDYLIRKYESDGDLVWSKAYDGTAGSHDRAYHVVTDKYSNVYITGESIGVSTGYDMLTVKYNASGTKLWHARMTGSGNRDDRGTMLTIDTSGNVYVTGYKSAASTLKDIATVKYNSSGTQQWISLYSGSANLDDEGNALIVDSLGNVYVAGKKTISSTNTDFTILKYNSSGSQQWVTTYDGPAAGIDIAQSLDVNENLNVFVCGSSIDSSGTFDIATMRLNSNGSVNWIYRYNGSANNTDLVTQLKIDVAGEIVLTAGSEGASTDMDYLTMCYTVGGTLVWSERYDGTANLFDQTSSLYVDDLANIYIGGAVSVSQNQFAYATLKYSQPEKNGLALDNLLMYLAQSFEDISKNDTVKNIINDHARRSVDEYYHIFFPQLFEGGLDSGIDIKAEMNAKLEDLYPKLAVGKDHVAKIIGGIHYRNILLNPHMIMPDFKQVDSLDLEMDDPLIAYNHTEEDYPIRCVNCEDDELNRTLPDDYVASVVVATIPESLFLSRVHLPLLITITNCVASSWGENPIDCEVCPTTTALGGVDEGVDDQFGNEEIDIDVETDGCLIIEDANELDDENNHEIDDDDLGGYAKLSKISGLIYYEKCEGQCSEVSVKKCEHPIRDNEYYEENSPGGSIKYGDILTLCTPGTDFNNWPEMTMRFGSLKVAYLN